MKVFKFGGASVKSVTAVKNIASILYPYFGERLIVVVSAMGKSTNKLEKIIDLCINGDQYDRYIKHFYLFHEGIVEGLLGEEGADTLKKVAQMVEEMETTLENKALLKNRDMLYSKLVAMGELISTTIVSDYLNNIGVANEWVDARDFIKTEGGFVDARVKWDLTKDLLVEGTQQKFQEKMLVTQGFIGRDLENNTTTLGREGSDFTSAILGWCLDAKSVTVWKDVPGILNADPKIIPEAVLFKELSYKEASEMTYYGAKVIHPKTIRPLATKKIPLYVKGFKMPEEPGTTIHDCQIGQLPPSIIFMPGQCLISFKVTDFNFVNEKNLSVIFHSLSKLDMKINLMQNSAISFSLCVDYSKYKVDALLAMMGEDFDIYYNTGLKLVTIKNYTSQSLEKYKPKGDILMEQKTRNNYRFLVSESEGLGHS